MPNLLFIESSPRDAMSASTAVAQALVDAWHGTARSIRSASGTGSLHPFDGAALQARYAALSGHDPTPEQNFAWSTIEAHGKRFHDADVVMFAIPLWNYTTKYKLKQLVDVVSAERPALRFSRGWLGDPEARR